MATAFRCDACGGLFAGTSNQTHCITHGPKIIFRDLCDACFAEVLEIMNRSKDDANDGFWDFTPRDTKIEEV